MLLASISDVGEYDAVIEAIRGVSDEGGATNYRAVKNRLLESFSEKHLEKGSIFGSKRIHNGHHRQGKSVRVTLARDDKDSISCYNCGKNSHYASDCRSRQNTKGKSSTSKGKPTKGKGSSSKSPKDSFMILAAVAESDNEEDPYESEHSKEDCDVYEPTYALTSRVGSSFVKYPHGTETAYSAVRTRTVFNQDNQCKFLLDSGASRHICNDVYMFTHIYDSPLRRIIVGNGESIECCKIGTVELDDRIMLLSVLYVPVFGANVISLSMLDKYSLSAYFFDGQVKIGSENDLEVFLLGKTIRTDYTRYPAVLIVWKARCTFQNLVKVLHSLQLLRKLSLTKVRSCDANGLGMRITELWQSWENSKKQM
jgi:hypothetical protein